MDIQQTQTEHIGRILYRVGAILLRYGLVALLLLFGAQKWTEGEAKSIYGFMANSPLFSWLYHVTSVQGASIIIGITEITTAILIATRPWLPKVSALGSLLAIGTFLCTLSFLVTTPHLDPVTQGFVMKDIFSLGIAVWSAGEALLAASGLATVPRMEPHGAAFARA